jgi:hypothetical protein
LKVDNVAGHLNKDDDGVLLDVLREVPEEDGRLTGLAFHLEQ